MRIEDMLNTTTTTEPTTTHPDIVRLLQEEAEEALEAIYSVEFALENGIALNGDTGVELEQWEIEEYGIRLGIAEDEYARCCTELEAYGAEIPTLEAYGAEIAA